LLFGNAQFSRGSHLGDTYTRQNGPACALRELGQIDRTQLILPDCRASADAGLNKDKDCYALASAVFACHLREIRDLNVEPQSYRAILPLKPHPLWQNECAADIVFFVMNARLVLGGTLGFSCDWLHLGKMGFAFPHTVFV
jgi:hypothetical protein